MDVVRARCSWWSLSLVASRTEVLLAGNVAGPASRPRARTAATLRHNRRVSIRTRLAWPLCLSLAVAGGCDGGALVPSPSASPSHPGVPPLAADDPGQLQWRGLLACADCEGIDMRLHLERADVPRYELVELFLVRGGEERFLERGRWSREGRLLRLQADDGAERVFAIEADGRLSMRDAGGAVPAGPGRTLDPITPSTPP